MTRPSRVEMLLEVAGVIARRSTCNRLNVGAVIARDGRILATGYNGPPKGMEHCNHLITTWDASKDPACQLAVHAEANAIAFSARYGTALDGSELFVTHSPCHNCAKLVINAGIIRVYYAIEYRESHGLDLLGLAGVDTPWGNGQS